VLAISGGIAATGGGGRGGCAVVILYHFTTLEFLGPDWQTPGEREVNSEISRGEVILRDGQLANAVWLMTDPEPGGTAGVTGLRIKLVLPSRDRRLVQWHRWARREYGAASFDAMFAGFAANLQQQMSAEEVRRRTRAWWMYWGAVLPESFAAVDVVRSQPWWLVAGGRPVTPAVTPFTA
jgi:hypothetical protein